MSRQHLETFLANLAHAVRNRETVTIGGGDFTHTELAAVLFDVKGMRDELDRINKAMDEIIDEILTEEVNK